MDTLRTECEKMIFDLSNRNDFRTNVIVPLASLERKTDIRARIIFIALVSVSTIIIIKGRLK